jgi:hypothetical protein
MKRVISIVFIVLVILGLGYFGMWFSLSQFSAMKVAWISKTVSPTISSSDTSGFKTAYRKAQQRISADGLKASATKFSARLNDICTRYADGVQTGDTSKPDYKGLQLAFLAEIIDTGLERAEYSEVSVPLGALKPVLLNYIALVKQNEPTLKALGRSETTGLIIKSEREYRFLLEGKLKVLSEMLNSNDATNIMVALKEIENSKIKRIAPVVLNIFQKTQNPELKMQAARTLFGMQMYKNAGLNDYLVGLLAEKKRAPEVISLLSTTDDPVFLKQIIPLTNSMDPEIKDAAVNAAARLKNK